MPLSRGHHGRALDSASAKVRQLLDEVCADRELGPSVHGWHDTVELIEQRADESGTAAKPK